MRLWLLNQHDIVSTSDTYHFLYCFNIFVDIYIETGTECTIKTVLTNLKTENQNYTYWCCRMSNSHNVVHANAHNIHHHTLHLHLLQQLSLINVNCSGSRTKGSVWSFWYKHDLDYKTMIHQLSSPSNTTWTWMLLLDQWCFLLDCSQLSWLWDWNQAKYPTSK